jgi:hypothetical protein
LVPTGERSYFAALEAGGHAVAVQLDVVHPIIAGRRALPGRSGLTLKSNIVR